MNADGFYGIGELYFTAKILFWIFTAGVLLLPGRWSLLCLAVMMQIDVSAPEFVGTASVGWENGVKALVLPALLLCRLAPRGWSRLAWTGPTRLWVLFVFYVGLAGVWSPHKIAAAKAVAYLISYLLLFWAFYWGWGRGFVDATFVSLAIWASLLLGCFQTFVMGNRLSPDGRFSSFCWAQEFAPWLVSLLAVALFKQEGKRVGKVTMACCVAGVVMTGSRLAFIGLACLFFVVWLKRTLGGSEVTTLRLVKSLSAAAVTVVVLCGTVLYAAPTNRITELLLLGSSDYRSLNDIGTAAARLITYEAIMSAVSNRSLGASVFGSGTGTGGDLVIDSGLTKVVGFEQADFVDPNRALNSDFFRALYEWGIVGLFVGIILVISLVRWVWYVTMEQRLSSGFALMGVMPLILAGLAVDNVLADAASPQGVGFILIISWAFWGVQFLGKTQLYRLSEAYES